MSKRAKSFSVLTLLAAMAISMTFVPTAEAGCLLEQSDCEGCAQKAMWQAMKNLSARGIKRANLQLWDCAIDLFHCVLFDSHHNYACAV